jgi:hypothetical protein
LKTKKPGPPSPFLDVQAPTPPATRKNGMLPKKGWLRKVWLKK